MRQFAYAPVAQWIERLSPEQEVASSILARRNNFPCSQPVRVSSIPPQLAVVDHQTTILHDLDSCPRQLFRCIVIANA